jgi:O-6-methylguanine DNA methyltransferase
VRTAATDRGLALIALPGSSKGYFEGRMEKLFPNHEIRHGGRVNKQAEKELTEYLAGKRKKFAVKLDIQGPPFYVKALAEVSRIPYGETRTYGEIAAMVGNPRASRAVGTANAHNNLPLIIPCHRVVASNGLGGYGGGEAFKRHLLKLEGVDI